MTIFALIACFLAVMAFEAGPHARSMLAFGVLLVHDILVTINAVHLEHFNVRLVRDQEIARGGSLAARRMTDDASLVSRLLPGKRTRKTQHRPDIKLETPLSIEQGPLLALRSCMALHTGNFRMGGSKP